MAPEYSCGSFLCTTSGLKPASPQQGAIDLEERAVANALASAIRNGLADRVTAESVDLYPRVPEERYEVIVASPYQMPVDPFEQGVTYRPRDHWDRSLLDHLIRKLPKALAPDGVAHRSSANDGPWSCSTSRASRRASLTSASSS